MKKTASALEHVNPTVLPVLPPPHIEGEMGRSEKREHRRGLPAERDDIGR